MGSVQQNNFLFTGTVLDNIRLARPEATEAEVRATLAALDCLDLIEALPRQLHTPVAERGAAAVTVSDREGSSNTSPRELTRNGPTR